MSEKFNKEHLVVYVFLGIIALSALAFTYTVFSPVDVLRNWYITTDKNEYSVGDTIKTTSKYDKVMSVSGKSKRYIECLNKNGSWQSYPISESSANAVVGTGEVTNLTIIPEEIPNTDTKCRVYFQVEYIIYMYRPFIEDGYSNEFHLKPKDGITKDDSITSGGDIAMKDDIIYSAMPESKIHIKEPPTVNNTPISTPKQEEPPKTEPLPAQEPTPQPSVIQQILESLFNLIRIY